MPTISIYQEEDNRTYQVNVDVNTAIFDRVNGAPSDYQADYYLIITTNMKKAVDNSSYPTYIIRNLSDTPPGYLAATTFTELVNDYIEYFSDQSELGQSSSSSSFSSSSSSSFLYSESSSSKSNSSSSSSSFLG